MANSGLLAWREAKFMLRNRVANSPNASANLVLFLAFKWLETPRQEQARLHWRGTTNSLFRCCCRHVYRWLPTASRMPLGSPVPFTSCTTHPSRGCTAATCPCQQPAFQEASAPLKKLMSHFEMWYPTFWNVVSQKMISHFFVTRKMWYHLFVNKMTISCQSQAVTSGHRGSQHTHIRVRVRLTLMSLLLGEVQIGAGQKCNANA